MKTGVLLMAHGFTGFGGSDGGLPLGRVLTRKPPTPEIIKDFQERYTADRRGRSPLLEISRKQARARCRKNSAFPSYVGMRHWQSVHQGRGGAGAEGRRSTA